MSGYKDLGHQERQKLALAAKQAMLAKHRAAVEDPSLAERQAERQKIHEAREVRLAAREAARKLREAELAAQAAREAEIRLREQQEAERLAAIAAAEEAERELALAAEKKAERDARYAARKAAKKQRRKG